MHISLKLLKYLIKYNLIIFNLKIILKKITIIFTKIRNHKYIALNILTILNLICLNGCINKTSNNIDPFEPLNREIYKFNRAFDATITLPPARLYEKAIPPDVRISINNAFNNVVLLPTIASDILQGELIYALKDSWRFLINSTVGIIGIFDIAGSNFGLPSHYNDLGLTFAKWGAKTSPFIMVPFFGPSTIRDGLGTLIEYTLFTPYPYLFKDSVIYGLFALRVVDLRAQMLEIEPMLKQSFDEYLFVRDAYLQYRNVHINGEQEDVSAPLYVD